MGITSSSGKSDIGNLYANVRQVCSDEIFKIAPKHIDDTQSVCANCINRIIVNSDFANVHINVAEINSIDVHLLGNVTTKGNVEFDVSKCGNKVIITAKIKGGYTCIEANLNIIIPSRMFEFIYVQSRNGSISIAEGVVADRIQVNSMNKNVEVFAVSKSIEIKSKNGNVIVYVNANSDISLNVCSMNGSVTVELHSICWCNLNVSSMNGDIRKYFCKSNGYIATGIVSSMNGNVNVTQT